MKLYLAMYAMTTRTASTTSQTIKERWKNVDLLLSDKGDLDTQDTEMSEVLNVLFVSIFSRKAQRLEESLEQRGTLGGSGSGQVIFKQNEHNKSMYRHGMHLCLLRELLRIGNPHLIIFNQSWQSWH